MSSGSHPGLSGPLVIHLHFSVRLSRHLFPIPHKHLVPENLCFRSPSLSLLSCQLAQGWGNSQGCGPGGWGSSPPRCSLPYFPPAITAEAAIRSVSRPRQRAWPVWTVEQLEKVLPQLVSGPQEQGLGRELGGWPTPIGSERLSPTASGLLGFPPSLWPPVGSHGL